MSEAGADDQAQQDEQDDCWAYGHETEDEPICIHCGRPVVGA